MGFRRSDLQPAFAVPGTFPFTVWGYATTDPLAEVLRPGYVLGGRAMLTLGDLIWVRTCAHRARPDEPERGETRAALVMVSGWTRSGDASLRLVLDFGRPDDGHGAARAPAAKDPPAPAAKDPPAPAAPAPARTKRTSSAKQPPARRRAPEPEPESDPPASAAPRRKRGRPAKVRTYTRL